MTPMGMGTSTGLGSVLGSRALQAFLVALVVGIVSFVMMQALPGDAAFRIAAGRYGYDMMNAASAEVVRAELGLDRPLLIQLGSWLWSLAQFDMGRSLVTGAPVVDEIAHQLGASLLLAGVAISVSVLIALPLGVASGLRPGGLIDRITLTISVGIRALPIFALAVLLILILAVQMKLLPVAGFDRVEHLVLPSLALGLSLAAVSNRVVRDTVVDAIGSDWHHFALTKGLSRRITLLRHVARNAAVPVVAYIGVQLAFLIEGVVIIESVFSWPGIGHALVHAVFSRDVPMVQGTALTLGLLYVLLNLIIDLLCRGLDPRGAESAA